MNAPESREIVFWVSINTSEVLATNYECGIRIKQPVTEDNDGQHWSSITYNFVAHSMDTPFADIYSSGVCGIFPYDSVIPFSKRHATCHCGKTYEYKFKIFVEVESSVD